MYEVFIIRVFQLCMDAHTQVYKIYKADTFESIMRVGLFVIVHKVSSCTEQCGCFICCIIVQGGLSTIGDIYEVGLETEKSVVERLQIFDTPGSVSEILNIM